MVSYAEKHQRKCRSVRNADDRRGRGGQHGLAPLALVGAYHTSVDTPRNLLRAARRFEELGRPEVAAYLEERAREETGHDRLALKDLRALGVPGERLVANYIPEGIKPLCKQFDDPCVQDYPA